MTQLSFNFDKRFVLLSECEEIEYRGGKFFDLATGLPLYDPNALAQETLKQLSERNLLQPCWRNYGRFQRTGQEVARG